MAVMDRPSLYDHWLNIKQKFSSKEKISFMGRNKKYNWWYVFKN